MRNITIIIVCLISILNFMDGINFHNGKYRDVNIVIQNTVEENDELIDRIKEIFTNASRLLYEATRRQVYFGQINITIPNTWSSKTDYTEIPTLSDMNTYITVDDGTSKAPYTKRKSKKCGSPGHYIYLPASFVLQEGKTKFGNHENVVVHEWGNLRWGLWDEYRIKGKRRFYLEDGIWKPVGCSRSITGKVGIGSQCTPGTSKCDVSNTGVLINDSCMFCPDESQTLSDMSSIMAFTWVDAVTTFCDNENGTTVPVHQRHNSRGNSKQNLKCNGRSSWEVMREHDDFKTATTLPESTDTVPTFRLQQETVKFRVFVLDVSGSMSTNSRITKLFQASEYMIQTKIPANSWLGIVWFDSTALKVKELTQVTSQQVRDELTSALPQEAGGGTCIGCGIYAGLDYLRDKLGDPAGSEIIVISDGIDGHYNLDHAIQTAVDENVIIHSISISQAADQRMITMATETGGNHISYLEIGSISMASAFEEILSDELTSFATESITLVSEILNTPLSNVVETGFDIDSSVGNSTSVTILQESVTYVKADVYSPNGTMYTKQTIGDSLTLDIPGTANVGHYNVTITTSSPSLELHVTTLPTNEEAIRVSSWITPISLDFSAGQLPVIEAEVMKGRSPVLNADVFAVTETNPPMTIPLHDNGQDPDDEEGDGVYSGVFPPSTIAGNGRVSAKVYVKGVNGTATVRNFYSGAGYPDTDEEEDNSEVLQENFERQALPNEIIVENYVSGDVTAPGRITDVSIIDISTENTQYGESRNFTITWTATGDDVNIGQAIEYELRISDDNVILENDFASADLLSIANTNFTPKASGEAEFIRIEIDAEESYTSTTFFAVRAKDEAGNVGAVSNIISILVANGYRMAVVGNVVYSHRNTDDAATEEAAVEKEKKQNLITLAIGLSSAAAVIVVAIVTVTICVKNKKAKNRVEDSEFGSRTSTTTVFSIENLLKDFFTVRPTRPTVAKKVFQSSQLETIPEREHHWAAYFLPKPMPTTSEAKRKPFDIISQGSCNIEMLSEHSFAFDEKSLDNDTRSLCSRSIMDMSHSLDGMSTFGDNMDQVSDILPGQIEDESTHNTHLSNREVQCRESKKGLYANENKCEFLATLTNFHEETLAKYEDYQNGQSFEDDNYLGANGTEITRDIGKVKSKRFELKRGGKCFDERSTTDLYFGFPVLDSNIMSKEITKMYGDIHF